ncbi:hypothetical protein D9M69_468030 [compost metagenome]
MLVCRPFSAARIIAAPWEPMLIDWLLRRWALAKPSSSAVLMASNRLYRVWSAIARSSAARSWP